ncbi:hypothetical protein [Lutibacter sp.]|uniref:hypothetical protein n=1 Tax=Lutibacter sp. TaxID=1925666 RepID=UPI002736A852|nr:hypothetical protein [Lutibacter sp.]MDP3312193.1 hypothetical protein [Lutibacter sp.]
MNLTKLFFAAVIVLSANAAFAQDTKTANHLVTITIPQVALLDLEVASGTTDVTLAGTAPSEAGLPMTFGAAATNSAIWMNYSSIVKGALLRNVTVAITNGTVPTGLKLTVLASAAAGGAGTLGAASTELILTGTAQNIVTAIGSAYTEDGANKGRNLTYQLGYAVDAAANYGALRFVDTAAPLTITYTLTDI